MGPHQFPPDDPDFPAENVIEFSFVDTAITQVKEYTKNNKPTVIVLIVFSVVLVMLLIIVIVQAANMASYRKHFHAVLAARRRR